MPNNLKVQDHPNFGPLVLLAFIFPAGGLACGIIFVFKDSGRDRELGKTLIYLSLLAAVIWFILKAAF